MANQRVDQISDDLYGPKILNNFLNPAAFAQPAAGSLDLALSRLVSLAATRTIELRPGGVQPDPRIMQFGIKYGF
jgi:hypothetical protein